LKKKSASQSAFLNQRILIGLFIVLIGVFLALAGFGAFSEPVASAAQARHKLQTFKYASDPLVPPLFDCPRFANWAYTSK
jgi:hypothetical protein